VPPRERPEDRERNRMIAADDERDGAGVVDRADARLDRLVTFFDADRRRVDVAGIGYLQAIEWRDFLKIAVRPDERGLRANFTRRKPGARTVRRAAVVRDADDCDVEAAGILDVRQAHERGGLRESR